jgi:hypothetical protein
MGGAVLIRAVLLLPLLAVSSRTGLPLIVLVTLLANAATQFFLPTAAAALPVVVGPAAIAPANTLLSFVNSAVRVTGTGLAGLLFARSTGGQRMPWVCPRRRAPGWAPWWVVGWRVFGVPTPIAAVAPGWVCPSAAWHTGVGDHGLTVDTDCPAHR